jgi:hypothetical protein
MTYYLIKLLLSAGIIVAVSEIAKFNTTLGALLLSLPIVSMLAIVWLYVDTRDAAQIAELTLSTFWLVLPTLPLFLVLPMLLKMGWAFYPAFGAAVGVMLASYLAAVALLSRFGISL